MTRLTPAPPAGELIDSPPFPKSAPVQLANPVQRKNLHHAMTTIRTKRANVVAEKADWEAMRVAGAQIKDRTLRHLDEYLVGLRPGLGRVLHDDVGGTGGSSPPRALVATTVRAISAITATIARPMTGTRERGGSALRRSDMETTP